MISPDGQLEIRKREVLPALIIAALLAGGTTIVFGGGAMSIDSVEFLRAARSWSFVERYPPIISVIWRVLDSIYPGPALMVCLTTGLTAIGMWLVARGARLSAMVAWPVVVVTLLFPPVFGILGVVWTDILMLAGFSVLLGLSLHAQRTDGTWRGWILPPLLLADAITLFVRHNSALVVIPVHIFLLSAVLRSRRPAWSRRRAAVVATAVGLFATLLLAFALRATQMRFLSVKPAAVWQTLMVFDLAGIEVRTGERVFAGTVYQDIPPEDVAYLYHPRSHTALYNGNQLWIEKDQRRQARVFKWLRPGGQELRKILHTWISTIVRNPLAYIEHRAAYGTHLLGLNNRFPLWTPVLDGVKPNDLGIPAKPRAINSPYLRQLDRLALTTPLFKPWLFLLLLGPLVLLVQWREGSQHASALPAWRRLTVVSRMLAAAAVLHTLGVGFLAGTADFRYNHLPIALTVLLALMVLCSAFCAAKPKV